MGRSAPPYRREVGSVRTSEGIRFADGRRLILPTVAVWDADGPMRFPADDHDTRLSVWRRGAGVLLLWGLFSQRNVVLYARLGPAGHPSRAVSLEPTLLRSTRRFASRPRAVRACVTAVEEPVGVTHARLRFYAADGWKRTRPTDHAELLRSTLDLRSGAMRLQSREGEY